MATAATIQTVQKIYIAFYQRPADAEGLAYWADRLEAAKDDLQEIIDGFATSLEAQTLYGPINSATIGSVINAIYQGLFGRGVDPEGLDFYSQGFSSGAFTAGTITLAILNGAREQDKQIIDNKLAVASEFTSQLQYAKFPYDMSTVDVVRSMLASVTADTNLATFNGVQDAFAKMEGAVFTLTEIRTVEQLPDTYPTQKLTYWGNPETGEGVPAGEVWGTVQAYLSTAEGMSGNLFDINKSLNKIENISIVGVVDPLQGTQDAATTQSGPKQGDYTGDYQITVTLSDGTINTAIVQLTQEQFDFLNGLLFDANGNSRLFEKDVAYTMTVKDVMGNDVEVPSVVAGDKIITDTPIVLTPTANNGGTEEARNTTAGNDLIVAARLELLHGAYIDGGLGINTLEIDAKGHFAQPKELLNIQHVKVENLPNVYTTTDANGNVVNVYPDVVESDVEGDYTALNGYYVDQNQNSVVDLSRAKDIETLTVTEGNFEGLNGQASVGSLTIAGIRNGITTTLDGSFTQDVTLHYGELQGVGVNLVFNNLSMGDTENDSAYPLVDIAQIGSLPQLNVAHNAEELTITTTGGDSFLASGNLGGKLNLLTIKGTEHLYIQNDLDPSFHDATPVTIDASANTGGVNLTLNGSEIVTFKGSQADDRFLVSTVQQTGIAGGIENRVTITDLNGNNHFEVDSDNISVTVGDGNNNVELTGGEAVVVAGNGNNTIDAETIDAFNVTVGSGNNEISALDAGSVSITTGSGDNTVTVSADVIAITTGAGNDSITVAGLDNDYTGNQHGGEGAVITVNTGAGADIVQLGYQGEPGDESGHGAIIAKEGSSITGENITLVVQTTSDLRAATLDGITAIVLDDDNFGYPASIPANGDEAEGHAGHGGMDHGDGSGNRAVLTLTDKQVEQLAADGVEVRVDGGIFHTSAHIKVIVTEDLDLTADAWSAWLDSLPVNVDLQFEINDGATLTISAQQLHTKVAAQGITITNDGNTDQVSGKVIITGAGLDFDPFNNSDQIRTNIDGREYVGGSLSADFVKDLDQVADGVADEMVDGVQRAEWGFNVLIDRVSSGYNRPADALSYSRLTINTDEQDGSVGPFETIETFLRITGEADMAFTPVQENSIDDWGRPIEGGSAIELGVDNGEPTNSFMVDFSSAGGTISNLTLAHFQNADAIYGNGTAEAPVRVNVEIDDGGVVANKDANGNPIGGLVSRDVQTYVVTDISESDTEGTAPHSAQFWTSRVTEDLQTLGLRGNYEDTITFVNTERGVDFLMEVAYDKYDGYAVGSLVGEFARPGAAAVVNVKGLSTLPAGEVQKVAGITLTNAATAAINVEGGNTVIKALSGAAVESFTFTADANLTVEVSFIQDVTNTVDGTGVAGNFNITVSGEVDLSDVALLGIDQLVLQDGANVTLSAAQLVELADKIVDGGDNTTLNVVELSDEALDLSAIDVDAIGTVTFADVAGTIAVDAATNFGNADSVTILAETSDTSVVMTAAQFGTITAGTVNVTEAAGNDATLVLNSLANNKTLNLDGVAAAADVVLRVADLVATAGMVITEDNEVASIKLEVSGVVDLSKANLKDDIDAVTIAAGATLTLTADQAFALADGNNDGAATAAEWAAAFAGTGTLNIVGLSDQALNLNAVAAAGITIGTVTVANSDAAITIDAATTFGNAAEIITPTADMAAPEWGTERTSVTMTVDQFASSGGVITGDAQINLTGLYNNVDTDGDYIPDSANFDLSGIANPGTITFADDTVNYGTTGQPVEKHVTLTADASLGGFTIALANDDLIRFATEEQAAATITATGTTGVQWLWTTFGAEVNTSGYSADITTLFIDEALLVSQAREEDLWTVLDGDIVVQKINGTVIPELVKFNRTNTFEAFSNIPEGINYDDDADFSTVATLTMNLEGEVNLGNILLGDTNNGDGSTPNIDGRGFFSSLTINSYQDFGALDPDTSGRVIEANYVGNIGLNAGSVDKLTAVTINTYAAADGDITTPDGFVDVQNVNDAEAERDGLAIEVGTIAFAANTAEAATLTLAGNNAITIAGVNIADAEVSLLDIDATAYTGADADLVIGGIAPTGGSDASNALGSFDHIYVVDGYTAPAAAFGEAGDTNLLVVAGGANDFSAATSFDIAQVHVTADGTLTLTADQVAAIGFANTDADNAADAWSALAGVAVKLNIVGYNGQDLDLNAVEAAGFDIGTITVAETAGTVTFLGTLGNADSIIVPSEATTIALTATQFLQLEGAGTITGEGAVTITDLVNASNRVEIANPNNDERWSVNIDLSDVTTTGAHTLFVAAVNTPADVTVDAMSDLGNFTVVLDDINSDVDADNELAGQTIRFTTQAQAGRPISVTNADNDAGNDPASVAVDEKAEKDTNVVWEFTSVTGPVNTSGYDAELGRLWVSDVLVQSNNDLEDLFSASDLNGNSLQDDLNLNGAIIVRIVNTQNLDLIDYASTGFNRTVEIEAYTDLSATGLVFNEQDQLIHVENLILDLGGNVKVGNVVIDNIIRTTNTAQGSDPFDTLTINSYLADTAGHYLLPEDFQAGVNVYPSGINEIGDIKAGDTRNELRNVVVEATDVGVKIREVLFEEDTANSAATFMVIGPNDVEVKSLNTSDPEITSLTITKSGEGTLSVTGGSPAVDGGDATGNTEVLTIVATDEASEVVLGRAKTAPATGFWAGVYGDELSTINLLGEGDIDLGVIAAVDSVAFTLNGTSTGNVSLTLGQADVNGPKAPTLAANGTWSFNFAPAANVQMSITQVTGQAAMFNAGGTLNLTNIDSIAISGNVNLSVLGDKLNLTNVAEFVVPAGSILKLTAEQADGLTVTGAGTVEIVEGAKSLDADLDGIMTAEGDTGTVTLAISTADDADIDASETADADTNPEDLIFTGTLGVAAVTVTGTGSLALNAAVSTAGEDRDNNVTTPNDRPSFVVATGATLVLADKQANGLSISGAGSTTVNMAGDSDADLSGVVTTGATLNVTASGVFSGDLGALNVTVQDGVDLEVAYSIITGNAVNEVAAPAGTGTLTVLLADTDTDAAADMATIGGNLEARTAVVTATMTFTGDFDGADVEVTADRIDGDAAADTVTLTTSADRLDGLTVTGVDVGADDILDLVITSLATNLAADLGGVTGFDAITGSFAATGTFTGTLPLGMLVTVEDGVVLTTSATNATRANFVENTDGTGTDGTMTVTVRVADAAVDLNDVNDNDVIAGTNQTEVTINSITVVESLTFTGTLHNTIATGIVDGATLTVADPATLDGKTLNATGTTGAVRATGATTAAVTLAGSADFTIDSAGHDVNAAGVTGDLAVTVTAPVIVTTATGANTITATALTDGQVVTVEGTGNATVSVTAGDVTATTTGNVTFVGTDGSNVFIGGAGNDVFTGGAGNDIYTGGAGADTFNVGADTDTITLFQNGDVLVVTGAANANATIDSTFIATTATSNTSSGTVTLNITNDGLGVDMSAATGTAGYTINGSGDADIIIGSAFADVITGGAGVDEMTGGAGNDLFVFATADIDTTAGVVTDIIRDFGTGTDTIDGFFGSAAGAGVLVEAVALVADLTTLLTDADTALNGTVKYYVGQVDGGDVYVVTDENGTGYTEVIRLVGQTLVTFDGTASIV